MSTRTSLVEGTSKLIVGPRKRWPKIPRNHPDRWIYMKLQPLCERWERKVVNQGKAEALIIVLESRGLSPTSRERKQILQCEDEIQLNTWICGVCTASDVKTLLALPAQPRRRTTRRAA